MQNLLTENRPEFSFISDEPRLSVVEDPLYGIQSPIGENALETLLDNDYAIPLLLAGKFGEYLHSVESISPQVKERYPKILIYQATAMLFSEFSKKKIEVLLDKAEQLDQQRAFEGEILTLRGILESHAGDPERGIELSQKAFTCIEQSNTFFKNLLERNLGVAFTLKGDLINANKWLEKFLMSSFIMRDWVGVLAAYNYLTFIRKIQGRLKEAKVIYRKALAFIDSHHLEALPHSIKIISGYGSLHLHWHRIQEAKFYFSKAIYFAKKSDPHYAFTAYKNLCEAYMRDNDNQSALSVIDQLQDLFAAGSDLYEKIHYQSTLAIQARVSLQLGRLDLAYEWLRKSKIDQSTSEDLQKRFGYILGYIMPIAAQIYTSMGETNKAIEKLNAVIPKFLFHGANAFLIRALSALAAAYYQKGQKHKAHETLKKAIKIALPEDNLGDFIFVGKSLTPLVEDLHKSGWASEFTHRLLKILIKLNIKNHNQHNQVKKTSQLSQRELDVLELLAKGMTNQQIAQSLFLSSNTIKSHSIKIYRKLNVKNRNQAVIRARAMGILPVTRQSIQEGFHAIL